MADAYKSRRHHHRAYIVQDEAPIVYRAPYAAAGLVMHPASKSPVHAVSAARALPCDQPGLVMEALRGGPRPRKISVCDWR